MLMIRDVQMHAFRDKFLQEFETRRLADIARRFPTRYRKLGEGRTRAIIQKAVKVCDRLGAHGELDVANFIDLMIWFGESFAWNPKLAFETQPLRNPVLPGDARVQLTMARLGVEPGFHE
jgi:hypothetical protein